MDKVLLHEIPSACKRLSIGRSKLYDLARDGRIVLVKIGRRSLVPDVELERVAADLYAEALRAREVA